MEAAYAARFGSVHVDAGAGAGAKATPPHRRSDLARSANPLIETTNIKPHGTPPLQKYEPHDLRGIGRQCGNRLPPANAVQAMFSYEMQRQTEVEKLFHNLIFENAREKKEDVAKEKRLVQLEARLTQLEKQTMLRDLEQRIYRTDLRIDDQQKGLATSNASLTSVEDKLATLQTQLENLSKKQEEAAAALAAAPIPDTNEESQTIKDEINILFDDRDGILSMLSDLKTRLTCLEDNTRSLTLQMSDSARSSPVPTQRIAAKTSTGDLVDLSVPKGQGLNARVHGPTPPDRVRSFQPGKPWVG